MSTAPTTKALRSLQIGRGFAAMAVVLYHLNNSIFGMDKYFPQQFSQVFQFGNAGVQFFFVLSGFIICLVHTKDIGKPEKLPTFAFKRFARVYPTYWIVLATVVAGLILVPGWGTPDQRSVARIAASLTLIPYPQDPIMNVAWTLVHEVFFYAMFALLIVNARTGKWAFALWQLGCLGNTCFGSSDYPFRIIFAANNLLFSFGMLAAVMFQRRPPPAPGYIAMGGIVAFLLIGLHEVYAIAPFSLDTYVLAFGVCSAITIYGACSYEKEHGLRAPRFLDAIGDASYSIYLIHFPLVSLLAKVLFATGLAMLMPQSLSLLVLVAAVALVGVLFSRTIEMPLIATLGKLKAPRSRATT